MRSETGTFIKVGCIKINGGVRPTPPPIATTAQNSLPPRWCGYLLNALSLYLGSAVHVLKEWNMTGKKKVSQIKGDGELVTSSIKPSELLASQQSGQVYVR